MSSPTLDLAMELIRRRSVTPDDAGCQALLAAHLTACDFRVESLPFGDVSNLWAVHGTEGPLFVFAGHTDVVPPGPTDEWQTDPFEPSLRDGLLYGRGAADMKGSLAAMITAAERFIASNPAHTGRIGFLLTSDEEGPATDGTVRVIETLRQGEESIAWCIVGEPSSSRQLGDTVKNGRRGSLSGEVLIKGMQGHVAYPQEADNPIHRLAPALAAVCDLQWDSGDEHFPPTSLQLTRLETPPGAENVIPGSAGFGFNLRYSPAQTAEAIQSRITSCLDQFDLDYEISWRHSGQPFITQPGQLLEAVTASILDVTGVQTQLSTAGGTSDGRFIAVTGAEIVELGPVNASIHKLNEHVRAADLEQLSRIYEEVLRRLLK